MKGRWLAIALVSLAAALPAGAARQDPHESPYSCGFCLFEVGADGKHQHVVLDVLSLHLSGSAILALSPNRRRLLFSKPTTTGEDLWSTDLAGDHRRLVVHDVRGGVSWSPDGRKISFVRGSGLWLANANGANQRLVFGGRVFQAPVWAPDSRHLAFLVHVGANATTTFLTVLDTAALAPVRLAAIEGFASDIAWTPDGRSIAYTTVEEAKPPNGHVSSDGGRRAGQVAQIRIVAAAGGPSHALGRGGAVEWAPKGRRLAYVTATPWYVEPPTADLTERAPTSLRIRPGPALDRRCCEGGPHWSSDGRSLAYVNIGRGAKGVRADQVFTVALNAQKRRQLTHLLPGGLVEGVFWTTDGKHLLFLWEFTNVD